MQSAAGTGKHSISSSYSRLSGQEVVFFFLTDGLMGSKADTTGFEERQC